MFVKYQQLGIWFYKEMFSFISFMKDFLLTLALNAKYLRAGKFGDVYKIYFQGFVFMTFPGSSQWYGECWEHAIMLRFTSIPFENLPTSATQVEQVERQTWQHWRLESFRRSTSKDMSLLYIHYCTYWLQISLQYLIQLYFYIHHILVFYIHRDNSFGSILQWLLLNSYI